MAGTSKAGGGGEGVGGGGRGAEQSNFDLFRSPDVGVRQLVRYLVFARGCNCLVNTHSPGIKCTAKRLLGDFTYIADKAV